MNGGSGGGWGGQTPRGYKERRIAENDGGVDPSRGYKDLGADSPCYGKAPTTHQAPFRGPFHGTFCGPFRSPFRGPFRGGNASTARLASAYDTLQIVRAGQEDTITVDWGPPMKIILCKMHFSARSAERKISIFAILY